MTLFVIGVLPGCSGHPKGEVELKRFPMDSLDGIITRSGAELDTDNTSDGNGSLRIVVKGPGTVRLFEVSNLDVQGSRIMYQAKIKVKELLGRTYLELKCHFPDGEELVSINANSAIKGTAGWTTAQTFCSIGKGKKPDIIKLNLVVDGKGTVWIDDVRLIKMPLQKNG